MHQYLYYRKASRFSFTSHRAFAPCSPLFVSVAMNIYSCEVNSKRWRYGSFSFTPAQIRCVNIFITRVVGGHRSSTDEFWTKKYYWESEPWFFSALFKSVDFFDTFVYFSFENPCIRLWTKNIILALQDLQRKKSDWQPLLSSENIEWTKTYFSGRQMRVSKTTKTAISSPTRGPV